ncbi:hypothetical protein TanjilG_11835 [Lupinus angustifolius]|uniref:Reverse transcriptase domain-containing protein n=1 Tax=Lupinus angustifolius TaxID=3871 RepID=A0A4P1R6W9_LUPAN|nr:hypothetical protein TanjilG_11835 [Lupinus angustifolius]
MHSYKAPRLDGFQPIFYKTYWNIVGRDIHDMIVASFTSGTTDPVLADTLVMPIPKVDNPMSLKDFLPISLCNVLLKLVSKILVNRIHLYLDSFIGPL